MAAFLSKVTAAGTQAWEELSEPNKSNTGSYGRSNRSIMRAFRVAKGDTVTFFNECYTTTFPGVGAHPTLTNMYVSDVAIDHMPGAEYSETSGVMEPDYYLLTVSYAPLETQGDDGSSSDPAAPQDALTGSIITSTEAMTLPGYGLQWDGLSGGEEKIKEGITPYLIIPTTQFTVIKPRQSSIPWAAERANKGRVNANTFWGYPPETVLYMGMQMQFRYSTDGSRQYDITHTFSARQIVYKNKVYGWNHQYHEGKKDFYKVKYGKAAETDPDRFIYDPVTTFSALVK